MTSQSLTTGNVAAPINFENYALLYDRLTAAQADLDEETCRLPIWWIFPNDRELKSLWTELISVGQSLAEFLDASDEKYSMPASPMIMVGRCGAMEIGERRPFDNYELLQRNFPPSTRRELETRVLRFRDVMLAYYNRLMAKVRDLLYDTRIDEQLLTKGLSSLLLRSSLILDEANFERFRLILQVTDDGDNYDFEHFVALREAHESLKTALEEMNEYFLVTDPQSREFPLLREYIAVADSYREDMLIIFGGYLDLQLSSLLSLNPRWSHPGEPLYSFETQNS
jgi:hypothetical protein